MRDSERIHGDRLVSDGYAFVARQQAYNYKRMYKYMQIRDETSIHLNLALENFRKLVWSNQLGDSC